MKNHPFIPFRPAENGATDPLAAATAFYGEMDGRRSLRDFSDRPIDRAVIENIIMAASTAPSGAHKQPWVFCAVSDPAIKRAIRTAAEKEEHENYHSRMTDDWLRDLAPLGTDEHKPFLETAPWLIVVFKKSYDLGPGGEQWKNYYVAESVGIACGLLLAAIHRAGLVALTHTPSPMNFLQKILGRPANEKAFLLIPVGYPEAGAMVPDIKRKGAGEVIVWF